MSVLVKTFADFFGKQWEKLDQHFPVERQNGPGTAHEEQAWSFQFPPSSVTLTLEEKQLTPCPCILLQTPQGSSSNCWAVPKFYPLLWILGLDGLSSSTVQVQTVVSKLASKAP